jgi:uncharacterized membrane protein YgdD (TMEM256/DUF423 family)
MMNPGSGAPVTASFPLVIAGLMGAAGVALAAASAHVAPAAGLGSAAQMLLVHALAVIGGTAVLEAGHVGRPLARIARAGWILGAALFAGDVALRAFAGHRLFPMAAPAGGMLLIAAWIAFALSAIAGRR